MEGQSSLLLCATHSYFLWPADSCAVTTKESAQARRVESNHFPSGNAASCFWEQRWGTLSTRGIGSSEGTWKKERLRARGANRSLKRTRRCDDGPAGRLAGTDVGQLSAPRGAWAGTLGLSLSGGASASAQSGRHQSAS